MAPSCRHCALALLMSCACAFRRVQLENAGGAVLQTLNSYGVQHLASTAALGDGALLHAETAVRRLVPTASPVEVEIPNSHFGKRVLAPAMIVPALSLSPVLVFGLCMFMPCGRPALTGQEATLQLTPQQQSSSGLPEQSAEQGPPLTPPTVLMIAVMVASFLAHANLTVAMPTSERATAVATSSAANADLAHSVAHSGYILGAYGIGAMIGLPAFLLVTRRSIRSCFLLQCFCLILGNTLYCYAVMSTGEEAKGRWWNIPSEHAQAYLFLGRLVAGVEAGANYTCYMAFTIFTDYRVRAQYFGLSAVGAGVGLVCGPALASLSQDWSMGFHPEVAGTLVLLIFGVLFFVFLCAAFPGQEQLFALRDLDIQSAYAAIRGERTEARTEDIRSEWSSWMALLTGLAITFSRIYLRIAWESGAAVIIAIGIFGNSGDGVRISGYILAVPGVVFVPGQLILNRFFLPVCSTETLSRGVFLMEVFGIVAIFSFFDTARNTLGLAGSMGIFIAGSSIFYSGNQFNSSIFNTWMTKFSVPGHPVLNKEGILGLSVFSITIGYVLGPVVVRLMLSGSYSQDDFACFMLVGVLLQGAAAEVGMHWTEQMAACK